MQPYIHMVHLPEPRLAELLLALIIQTKIIFTSILARAPSIKNYCLLMHYPEVRWRKEENK
jgi:hypothetical protein